MIRNDFNLNLKNEVDIMSSLGKKVLAVALVMGTLFTGISAENSKDTAYASDSASVSTRLNVKEQTDLAGFWSPILYQDVGSAPEEDIPIPVNFDGDWSALNSWNNIGKYAKGSSLALQPATYWSVVESETHYFISYNLFYAAHNPQGSLGDHENDMEGMMLTIRKPGTTKENGTTVTNPNGELELVLMPRHAKLGMYSPASGGAYTPGLSTVYYDGSFTTETNQTGTHVLVYSAQNDEKYTESEGDFGHALKPYNGKGAKGKTGYVFTWGGSGAQVTNMNEASKDIWTQKLGNFDDTKRLNMELIPLESSLWPLRNDFTLDLWSSYGTFKGDDGRANAANAPWGWSFEGYRDLGSGRMLYDPAGFVDALFDGLGQFSHTYLTNAYNS